MHGHMHKIPSPWAPVGANKPHQSQQTVCILLGPLTSWKSEKTHLFCVLCPDKAQEAYLGLRSYYSTSCSPTKVYKSGLALYMPPGHPLGLPLTNPTSVNTSDPLTQFLLMTGPPLQNYFCESIHPLKRNFKELITITLQCLFYLSSCFFH